MASEPVEEATSWLDATRLACENTRLASEHTMMAWVRMAASLISFGCTIYTFFPFVRENEPRELVQRLIGPRGYGILMINLELFAFPVATLQHRQRMQLLRAHDPEAPVSLAVSVAALFSALGMLALLAVIFRQEASLMTRRRKNNSHHGQAQRYPESEPLREPKLVAGALRLLVGLGRAAVSAPPPGLFVW